MSPGPDDATELLREAGMRVTGQRVLVLAAMLEEPGDATANELHERLRAEHPRLGLATVYRALGSLAEAGILDTLQHGDSTCYRRCAPGHHHHLTCRSCHRVVELHDCGVGEWAERVGADHGFSGVGHELELVGTCERCAGSRG